MTAAYKAAGAGTITITSGGACTPAIPAGTVAKDVLIGHVFYGGSTAAPDTPANWTLLSGPHDLSTPATNGRVWLFGKKAVGGDAAPAFGTQAVTTPRRARVYSFNGALDDVIANIVGGFGFGTGTTTPCTDTGVTTGADSEDYLAVNLIAGSDDTLLPGAFTGETGGNWAIPGGFAAFTSTTGTPDTWMGLQTAVVAPSTTIDGGTAATTANDPWGVVGFYIRSKPPLTTPATLVATSTSGYNATTPKATGSLTWQTGDDVYVIGLDADAPNNALGTPTVTNLTGTDLTFNALSGFPIGGASQAEVYVWKATATGGGSGTIQGTRTSGADDWGIRAWQIRGSDGTGVVATLIDGTHVVSLARGDDHSLVIAAVNDWTADTDVTVDASPATGGTVRDALRTGGTGVMTVFTVDWTDQGSAGTTSYGVANAAGAGSKAKAAVEILGTITSGITQAINQVTETGTVQPITRAKARALVEVTGAGTVQPITRRKTLATAQITEAGTVQPVSRRKTVALGQVTEAGTARPITFFGPKIVPVAQITETGTVGAVTARKAAQLAQVLGAGAAQAVTAAKRLTIAQVTGAGTVQAIARLKTRVLAQLIGGSLVQPVIAHKTRLLGQASETGTPGSVNPSGPKVIPVGQVTGPGIAQPITRTKLRAIAEVTGAGAAQPVAARKRIVVGQAVETGLARPVTAVRFKPVGQVAEIGLAQAVAHLKRVLLGQVTETGIAQPITALGGGIMVAGRGPVTLTAHRSEVTVTAAGSTVTHAGGSQVSLR